MNVIKTGSRPMFYPIGNNIQSNMSMITRMADELIKLYGDKKLNLICMGSSGAIIAAVISVMYKNVNICHVKKEGEKSHTSTVIIGPYINVIVDDFIATGNTMRKIYEKLIRDTSDEGIVIDCLCVTGNVMLDELPFKPNNLICSE